MKHCSAFAVQRFLDTKILFFRNTFAICLLLSFCFLLAKGLKFEVLTTAPSNQSCQSSYVNCPRCHYLSGPLSAMHLEISDVDKKRWTRDRQCSTHLHGLKNASVLLSARPEIRKQTSDKLSRISRRDRSSLIFPRLFYCSNNGSFFPWVTFQSVYVHRHRVTGPRHLQVMNCFGHLQTHTITEIFQIFAEWRGTFRCGDSSIP